MNEIICDNLVFPECLRWREGQLWFVDMYDGKLMSVEPGKPTETLLDKDTILGGIGWLPDGRLILCDKSSRKLIGSDGKDIADLSRYHHAPINDLISLPDGTSFVGEYGFQAATEEKFAKGNLYQVKPDGSHGIAADGLSFPNGMALGLDNRTLFVAESYAQRITAFDISSEGRLSARKTFVRFDQGGPDGISIDASGNIWATLVGPKTVVKVNSKGEVEHTFEFDRQPYDVEVGENSNELFVAVSDAQFADLAKTPLSRLGQIERIQI